LVGNRRRNETLLDNHLLARAGREDGAHGKPINGLRTGSHHLNALSALSGFGTALGTSLAQSSDASDVDRQMLTIFG
jgi:uncharacterized protein YbaP (TraB family)